MSDSDSSPSPLSEVEREVWSMSSLEWSCIWKIDVKKVRMISNWRQKSCTGGLEGSSEHRRCRSFALTESFKIWYLVWRDWSLATLVRRVRMLLILS